MGLCMEVEKHYIIIDNTYIFNKQIQAIYLLKNGDVVLSVWSSMNDCWCNEKVTSPEKEIILKHINELKE